MNNSTIKQELITGAGEHCRFDRAWLVDEPRGFANLGSQMLWLAAGRLLTDLGIQLEVATLKQFKPAPTDDRPIIVRGGFLSDYFESGGISRQFLLERLARERRGNPLVFLPQSLFFRQAENLKQCAAIFNAHPDLTLMVREKESFDLARKYFQKTKLSLTPDTVFYLAGETTLSCPPKKTNLSLYLKRSDLVPATSPEKIPQTDITSDWVNYSWARRRGFLPPGAARLYREIIQRALMTPREFFSRQEWERKFPKPFRTAAGLTHSAIYQLLKYDLVVTDRLHGHLLSTLLGIPNVLLPDPRGRASSFFHTWTKSFSHCRFAENKAELAAALAELKGL